MKKVRIAIDNNKASKFLVESEVDGVWIEQSRFSKKSKAEDWIAHFYKEFKKEATFKYGK